MFLDLEIKRFGVSMLNDKKLGRLNIGHGLLCHAGSLLCHAGKRSRGTCCFQAAAALDASSILQGCSYCAEWYRNVERLHTSFPVIYYFRPSIYRPRSPRSGISISSTSFT